MSGSPGPVLDGHREQWGGGEHDDGHGHGARIPRDFGHSCFPPCCGRSTRCAVQPSAPTASATTARRSPVLRSTARCRAAPCCGPAPRPAVRVRRPGHRRPAARARRGRPAVAALASAGAGPPVDRVEQGAVQPGPGGLPAGQPQHLGAHRVGGPAGLPLPHRRSRPGPGPVPAISTASSVSRQTSATRISTVGWCPGQPGVEVEHALVEHRVGVEHRPGGPLVPGRVAEQLGRTGRRPAAPDLAAVARRSRSRHRSRTASWPTAPAAAPARAGSGPARPPPPRPR